MEENKQFPLPEDRQELSPEPDFPQENEAPSSVSEEVPAITDLTMQTLPEEELLPTEAILPEIEALPEGAKLKLQTTLQRIINEGSSGLICILL